VSMSGLLHNKVIVEMDCMGKGNKRVTCFLNSGCHDKLCDMVT
jgi:hypothetical protein